MDLLPAVRKFIEEQALLPQTATLVVGVSGGPDSLSLLDVLHRLAPTWQWTLHVAHLNHGLRPEAAAEADFVRAEAEKRQLAFHTDTVATLDVARDQKLSIEDAARQLRYTFLSRTARAVGAPLIVVAHTADDQAETVLMHILRGSGLAGLRGMLPRTDVNDWRFLPAPPAPVEPALTLVRPLLRVARTAIEHYCAERGLLPVHDATNADLAYLRNRIRRKLLPTLERYNPKIRAALGRLAIVAAGEYEVLRAHLDVIWDRIAQVEENAIRFDREQWLQHTPPIQWALLREGVRRLRPHERDLDFTPLAQAVYFSQTAQPGRQCDVLARLRLEIGSQYLVLLPWGIAEAWPDHLPLLTFTDELTVGWRFQRERLLPGEWTWEMITANADPWQTYVDATRIYGLLRLRARFPSERFQPIGLNGHSIKLSDFMINAKVHATWRARWPLVVCGGARQMGEVVWVAGLRLDERFKVTPQTRSVLRLWFSKTASYG